uniref:Uncharacterized protein n=1 Tax=Anguilla anguilla TaxID=7936 RepID=A0A0E9VEV6_ANGAN
MPVQRQQYFCFLKSMASIRIIYKAIR